jgi:hypothetical protein
MTNRARSCKQRPGVVVSAFHPPEILNSPALKNGREPGRANAPNRESVPRMTESRPDIRSPRHRARGPLQSAGARKLVDDVAQNPQFSRPRYGHRYA